MARKIKTAAQSPAHALAEALVPIARMLLRSGLGAGEMIQAAKLAYVHAAMREVTPKGRKPNVSRLAVVTGLTRKEIAALLQRENKPRRRASSPRNLQHRALRVLQGWSVDPLFQRVDGRPADLPLRDGLQSFHSLVKHYGGDVTPVSVLRELERMKAVTTTATAKVRFHRQTAAAKADSAQHIADSTRLLSDFANTLLQLAEPRETPLFFGFKDASVDSPQQAALFQRTFAKRAASLLASLDEWMVQQSRPGKSKLRASEGKTRVGLGVYLVEEDE